MSASAKVLSLELVVNKKIDDQTKSIRTSLPVTLPGINHPIVNDYVRKIEGSYDVTRSKEDTDNTIDLLYIAYNATPQSEGTIRSKLSDLMSRLISAQQESERKMQAAVRASERIIKSLKDYFPDWEDVCKTKDPKELIGYLKEDLAELAEEIKGRAEKTNKDLNKIAETYDGIIDDTTKVTATSEKALAARLKDKQAIQKEIDKAEADRQKIASLVKDLEDSIKKYEKESSEYKERADSAENRAFIMSIVRVGAQMVSSMVPAITAAATGVATGGLSTIAAAAAGTTKQATNASNANIEDDKTADVIQAKKDISDKKAEKSAVEQEKKKLEEKVEKLKENKEKLEEEDKKSEAEAVETRIKKAEEKIKKADAKISKTVTALNALQASLKSLDKNMEKMSDKMESQAASLRQLQMKMLEKVEKYQDAKREQAAELVKINALLKGQRTEEETIQLTIKSLNLSLRALKRAREIIVEISFFFKSFADFMSKVIEDAKSQSDLIQTAAKKDRLSDRYIKRVKRNTNDFFITQTAEWEAVQIVSGKFVANFNDGWSKLNKLNGNYLTGDELKTYLESAAKKIQDISWKRQEAARAKVASLQEYRDRIANSAA